AHLPIEGVGGFYGGLLHPILVLPHALSLLALGLFVGSRRDRATVAPVFAAALARGLIAIMRAVGGTPARSLLLAATAILGVLVALAWAPPKPVVWLFAAVIGVALALDSPPQAISIEEGNVMLLGTGLGACIALAAVIEITAHLGRAWQRISVRIA